MNIVGALFVAGSAFEASLLVVSIAAGWKWGPYRPAPAAFIGLLVVGAAATAATGGLGSAMMRTNLLRVAPANAQEMSVPPVVEARAGIALILGIAAVVLVWPFGVLLGPAAFWVGLAAVRHINAAPSRLTGGGRAQAGAIMGALVSGGYLFWVLVEVVAIFMFGEAIPAAP